MTSVPSVSPIDTTSASIPTSGTPISVSALPTSASTSIPSASLPPSSVSTPTSASTPASASTPISVSTPISASSQQTSASTTLSSTLSTISSSSTSTGISILSSNGVAVKTVTFTTTGVSTATTSVAKTSSSSGSSNHTGAIAGGVVGGVVVLALIGALIFFCMRRRSNKDDFDGNFDPDRVVGHSMGGATLPQFDLADEVTPFDAGASPAPQMGQYGYGDSPYGGAAGGFRPGPATTSAGSSSPPLSPQGHYSNPSEDPSQTYYNQGPSGSDATSSQYGAPGGVPVGGFMGGGAAAAMAANWGYPNQRPAQAQAQNPSVYAPRSAKEREALAARQAQQEAQQARYGVTNQGAPSPGSENESYIGTRPTSSTGGDGVVVHQDGGRVHPESPDVEDGPQEIPPTYDSIPADSRGR